MYTSTCAPELSKIVPNLVAERGQPRIPERMERQILGALIRLILQEVVEVVNAISTGAHTTARSTRDSGWACADDPGTDGR